MVIILGILGILCVEYMYIVSPTHQRIYVRYHQRIHVR